MGPAMKAERRVCRRTTQRIINKNMRLSLTHVLLLGNACKTPYEEMICVAFRSMYEKSNFIPSDTLHLRVNCKTSISILRTAHQKGLHQNPGGLLVCLSKITSEIKLSA